MPKRRGKSKPDHARNSRRIIAKKWTKSKANQYISRYKACKKLQLSINAFRNLCILKGIYPHDPKRKHKKEGVKKIYYHVSDIKNLWKEPILWKWRERHTFENKMTRTKGRHDWQKLKGMATAIPQVSIDHLIRERYPTFNEALRDLDDCLTFIFLFASVPSGIVPELTALRRMECQRLIREFKHYVAMHGLLLKAFISVKGYYYQIKLRSKFVVTWVAPHPFGHNIPRMVDFKVMSTFLDFYQNMLKFVMVRLYKMSNMKYPPFGDLEYEHTALSLTELRQNAFRYKKKIHWNKHLLPKKKRKNATANSEDQIETESEHNGEHKQSEFRSHSADDTNSGEPTNRKVVKLDLSQIIKEEDLDDPIKKEGESEDELEDEFGHHELEQIPNRTRRNLFQGFTFLLNRETPQHDLEFVILSMGGYVMMEQLISKKEARNPQITHQIVDRHIHRSQLLNYRQYIQPQWVFDCLNCGVIVPVEHYQIGVQCPPHLSPFVSYDDRSHKPSQAYVLEHWKEMAQQFGGFVPSKMLKSAPKGSGHQADPDAMDPAVEKYLEEYPSQYPDETQEIGVDDGDDIGMNLNIEDILDLNDLKSVKKAEAERTQPPEEEEVDDFVLDEGEQREIEALERAAQAQEMEADGTDMKPEEAESEKKEKKQKKQNPNPPKAMHPEKARKRLKNQRKHRIRDTNKTLKALKEQRFQIAEQKRKKHKATQKQAAAGKNFAHDLDLDGVAETELEAQRVELAKSFMTRNQRDWYEREIWWRQRKSRHTRYLETAAKWLENDKYRSKINQKKAEERKAEAKLMKLKKKAQRQAKHKQRQAMMKPGQGRKTW